MTQVTWILQSEILDRLVYHGRSFPDAINGTGNRAVVVSWEYGQPVPNVDVGTEQPVVLFGSHEFVKAFNPGGRYQPGNLGVNLRTSASSYMSNLPLDWFMNREAVWMPWVVFKERAKEFFHTWNSNKIFIRPNSGFKTFAGTPIQFEKLEDEIRGLDQLSSVMDETMILVAPPQNILGEFRFVIADGQVVAGSEYRWDGKLDIRRDWPSECEALAQKVADHPWQLDIAYTCDVALLEGEPKLIELNGFSCAGLYAADLTLVAREVSKAALKEFNGDDI